MREGQRRVSLALSHCIWICAGRLCLPADLVGSAGGDDERHDADHPEAHVENVALDSLHTGSPSFPQAQ